MYREYMKIAVIVIFYALYIGANLITIAVGRWLVFKKMGLPGWKGIIPFYSESVLFRKLWNIKLFWAYLALIAAFVLLFKLNNRLARAFGRIPCFAVGLTFIPSVFYLILGLSKGTILHPYNS